MQDQNRNELSLVNRSFIQCRCNGILESCEIRNGNDLCNKQGCRCSIISGANTIPIRVSILLLSCQYIFSPLQLGSTQYPCRMLYSNLFMCFFWPFSLFLEIYISYFQQIWNYAILIYSKIEYRKWLYYKFSN